MHLVIPQVSLDYLMRLPEPLRADVEDGIDYLMQFGRAAAMPDVKHRIAGHPDLSEVRVQQTISGRRYTIRALTYFAPRDVIYVPVVGDKDAFRPPEGQDWYDVWVPIALQVVDALVKGPQP